MAIDGVAPRAKLNQQRSRRFRSAKDMAEATKDNNSKNGEATTISSSGVFDSNCITPGTEFMERVSNAIKYFIRKKIKEDPHWRNLKIIYSGHEIPGKQPLLRITRKRPFLCRSFSHQHMQYRSVKLCKTLQNSAKPNECRRGRAQNHATHS